jgi:hypothetical protein
VNCSLGIYTGASAFEEYAKRRCCPDNTCDRPFAFGVNTSSLGPNAQCASGFTGPACSSCASGFTQSGDGCAPCPLGADFSASVGALFVVGTIWSFLMLFVMFKIARKKRKDRTKEQAEEKASAENPDESDTGKKKKQNKKEKHRHHHHHHHHHKETADNVSGATGRAMRDQMFISRSKDAAAIDGANSSELQLVYDRFKVLISSMQITSALCITFDDVPWPRVFKDFSLSLGVVNLDMSFLFGMTNCRLSLPFLDKFLLHALMPIVFLGALGAIHGISRMSCVKVHEDTKRVWKGFIAKISITVTLLIYVSSVWSCLVQRCI